MYFNKKYLKKNKRIKKEITDKFEMKLRENG